MNVVEKPVREEESQGAEVGGGGADGEAAQAGAKEKDASEASHPIQGDQYMCFLDPGVGRGEFLDQRSKSPQQHPSERAPEEVAEFPKGVVKAAIEVEDIGGVVHRVGHEEGSGELTEHGVDGHPEQRDAKAAVVAQHRTEAPGLRTESGLERRRVSCSYRKRRGTWAELRWCHSLSLSLENRLTPDEPQPFSA